jgi:photosystem II stability/assembly factor-like uncharacterized protein
LVLVFPTAARDPRAADSAAGALAAAPVWQSLGPSGGPIEALVPNPKNPRELFAAIDSCPAQVFKSSNAGKTWGRIGLIPSFINDLAVDPANPNVLYASNGSSLFKSKNQGRTFTELALPDPNLVRLDGNISINPRDPKMIFIAGSYKYNESARKYCLGVWRSRDGGRTWTVHKFEPVSDYTGYPRVAASEARAGLVYFSGSYRRAGQEFIRVFKSADGGNTWTSTPGSLDRVPFDIALHPADPDAVYIAASGYIYRSPDGGKTWSRQSSPSSLYATVLAMDARDPRVLYAGYSSMVYKSTDAGVRWTRFPSASGLFGYAAEIVADGGSVYFGSSVGVFKSANGGLAWRPSHAGMKAASVPTFALAPASPKTVYAEVAGYACFRSTNAGGSWARLGNFAGCGQILKIVYHPTSTNTIYLLKGG